jgi:2'-5' RNA ligase
MPTIGVAVAIPEPWATQLQDYRTSLGDTMAATIPTHITLVPPTEVSQDELEKIEAHLTTVASEVPRFQVHLRGTGTFRPVTEVVFVVVAAGISECERLAAAIGAAPELRREARFPYHPHVTVAHDVAPEALDRVYEDLADFSALFQVERFTLFLHNGEARWQPWRDFRLGG